MNRARTYESGRFYLFLEGARAAHDDASVERALRRVSIGRRANRLVGACVPQRFVRALCLRSRGFGSSSGGARVWCRRQYYNIIMYVNIMVNR